MFRSALLGALTFGFLLPGAYAYRDAVVVKPVVISRSGEPFGCDTRRIDSSPLMQRALRAVKAHNNGHKPVLTSCYRPQWNQDMIRRRFGCAPEYGSLNCNGVAARVSFHTTGVAADMILAANNREVCSVLDKVRNEVMGGAGGVGAYGGNLGHLEIRENGRRAAWNICGRMPGMRGNGIYQRPPAVAEYMRSRPQPVTYDPMAWNSSVLENKDHPNHEFMKKFLARGTAQ